MRKLAGLGFLIGLSALAVGAAAAQDAAAGRSALRSGSYDDAAAAFTRQLRANTLSVEARIGLIETLLATGQYERAIEVGREAPDPGGVANHLGEALLRAGRLDEAQAAFESAAAGRGAWALTAEVNLAELLFNRGRIDEAMERFDRFIDVYNASSGRMSAADLAAVGRAVTYLGRERPNLFQDALRAFDEASSADPGWHEPRVRAGTLFLSKYSSPEAKAEYEAVLTANPRHPDALLGMARAREFDNAAGAGDYLRRVLEVDPSHVEARALLARRHLSRGDRDEARAEIDRALEANPNALPALTALAAFHLISGDEAALERTRTRVLEINPRHAEMDRALADLAAQTRRYAEAVERARAAVALDPSLWEAWGLLGLNLLRVGEMDEGRAALDRAFEGDPFNPWFKNTLDLLDTFDRFTVHRTPHFELFLHGDEADLLATYLAPLAEEAYAALVERYGIEPPLPIRVELYPSHADFSVRTLGEAGLGALGVSFGSLVVMDSPSARTLGDYNWASVFWHELAHSFHLAMTDHRVPRWFSEGLAVHEQRQARAGWGHQPDPSFLAALRDGRLKPVSRLDDGFMRPDYPEQVIHSYYQASLVFELIEDRWGFGAIREMLEGYRRGEAPDALFETVLGIPIERFDETFAGHMRERFARALRGLPGTGDRPASDAPLSALEAFTATRPDDFATRLVLGARLAAEGRPGDAERHLRAAADIFPEYAGPDSPWLQLAAIDRERGDMAAAADKLARYDAIAESSYRTRLERAEILRDLGRHAEAAAVLGEAVLIWPYDLELHRQLGDRYQELGDFTEEVLQRRAVVALRPTDRAEAYYLLARAEWHAGDAAAARRSVLRALEVAPNYDEALQLLLELRRGGAPR